MRKLILSGLIGLGVLYGSDVIITNRQCSINQKWGDMFNASALNFQSANDDLNVQWYLNGTLLDNSNNFGSKFQYELKQSDLSYVGYYEMKVVISNSNATEEGSAIKKGYIKRDTQDIKKVFVDNLQDVVLDDVKNKSFLEDGVQLTFDENGFASYKKYNTQHSITFENNELIWRDPGNERHFKILAKDANGLILGQVGNRDEKYPPLIMALVNANITPSNNLPTNYYDSWDWNEQIIYDTQNQTINRKYIDPQTNIEYNCTDGIFTTNSNGYLSKSGEHFYKTDEGNLWHNYHSKNEIIYTSIGRYDVLKVVEGFWDEMNFYQNLVNEPELKLSNYDDLNGSNGLLNDTNGRLYDYNISNDLNSVTWWRCVNGGACEDYTPTITTDGNKTIIKSYETVIIDMKNNLIQRGQEHISYKVVSASPIIVKCNPKMYQYAEVKCTTP